jgi:predicted phage terminase large subunit-like protein
VISIRPQPGPQEQFGATCADIAIYGGAAGAGKTFGLLLEALRHVMSNAQFSAVIFRRTTVQVRNPGGLWDESFNLYGLVGGKPLSQPLEWTWPKGGRVKFAHLEHDSNVLDWQGSAIPLLCFDELTHFTRQQFFYMLSRNRSTCGVAPYVRATCNPDADSWVAELIAWWIDPETGYAIPERAGIVRWFIRINDTLIWADTREELLEKYGDDQLPKSLTFIPGKLDDNPALTSKDPGYRANLRAMTLVDQERLLHGNWKIRPAAGLYFQRSWCEVVDIAPANLTVVRYWDLAATRKTEENDPDWTVGVKLGRDPKTKQLYILHAVRMREDPHTVRTALKNTASADGKDVRIGLPQDPGQAGKAQAKDMVADLEGYTVSARPERGDKIARFSPFSAQCKAGNVKVLRGAWNEDFLSALESFPPPTPNVGHDDDADACGGAYGMLIDNTTGLIDFYREWVNELGNASA